MICALDSALMAQTVFVALCLPRVTRPKLPWPRTTPKVKSASELQGSKRPNLGEVGALGVWGMCACAVYRDQGRGLEGLLLQYSRQDNSPYAAPVLLAREYRSNRSYVATALRVNARPWASGSWLPDRKVADNRPGQRAQHMVLA